MLLFVSLEALYPILEQHFIKSCVVRVRTMFPICGLEIVYVPSMVNLLKVGKIDGEHKHHVII